MLYNNIAKLRAKRGRNGVSQNRLAQRIGLSRPHMCRIERGTQKPSIEVIFKLAEYFECPIEDIFVYEFDK